MVQLKNNQVNIQKYVSAKSKNFKAAILKAESMKFALLCTLLSFYMLLQSSPCLNAQTRLGYLCVPSPAFEAYCPCISILDIPPEVDGLCPGTIYTFSPTLWAPILPGYPPNTDTVLNYSWSPSDGISPISAVYTGTLGGPPITIPTSIIVPTSCATYNLTVSAVSENLISNSLPFQCTTCSGCSDPDQYPCYYTFFEYPCSGSSYYLLDGSSAFMSGACSYSLSAYGGSETSFLNLQSVHQGDYNTTLNGFPFFWGSEVYLMPNTVYQFSFWIRPWNNMANYQDFPQLEFYIQRAGGALETSSDYTTATLEGSNDFMPISVGGWGATNCLTPVTWPTVGVTCADFNWQQLTFQFTSPSSFSCPGIYFICLADFPHWVGHGGAEYSICDLSLRAFCTATAAITICPDPIPSVIVTPSLPSNCTTDPCPNVPIDFSITGGTSGDIVTYTGSGISSGSTVTLSTDGSADLGSITPEIVPTTTACVELTNIQYDACNVSIGVETCVATAWPNANFTISPTPPCPGIGIPISVSGDVGANVVVTTSPIIGTYTYATGGTYTLPGIYSTEVYCLNAVENSCCAVSESGPCYTVTPIPVPVLTLTASSPICALSSFTITVAGGDPGVTYNWTGPGLSGTIATTDPWIVVPLGVSGEYDVSYIAPTGCIISGSIIISADPPLYVTITSNPPDINGNIWACNTATITATVTGGSPMYNYLWWPTSSTDPSIIVPATPSEYSVTVTDAVGCTASSMVNVNQIVDPPPCVCSYVNDDIAFSPLPVTGTIISSSTTPGLNYYIRTPITIIGTVTFDANTIVMAEGVNITVPSGSKLIIKSSHLFCCYPNMWKGIILTSVGGAPTGQLVIEGDGNGHTSMIEDAYTAVSIPSPVAMRSYIPGSPTNLLTLYCNGVCFNKNVIGIQISNYNRLIAPITPPEMLDPCYPFVVENTVFTARNFYEYDISPVYSVASNWPFTWPNTLIGMGALKSLYTTRPTPYFPPYNIDNANACPYCLPENYNFSLCNNKTRAQMGIDLENVGTTAGSLGTASYSGFVLGGANVTHGGNPTNDLNLFDGLIWGVHAINSNVICRNSAYEHMSQLVQSAGDGIYSYRDFIAASSGNLYQLMVYGERGDGRNRYSNRFWDCSNDVEATDIYNIYGQYSEMQSNHQTTNIGDPQGQYGYKLSSSQYYLVQIQYDTLYNLQNGISFDAFTPSGTTPLYGQTFIDGNLLAATYSETPVSGGATYNEYMYMGIQIQNLSAFAPLSDVVIGSAIDVNNNQEYWPFNGIYIQGSNFEGQPNVIENNMINVDYDNVTGLSPEQAGISHVNGYNGWIYNNSVNGPGTETPPVSATTYVTPVVEGIHTSAVGKEFNECNDVSNINTGFYFGGTNTTLIWINNTMQNNAYGYVLDGIIGGQGATVGGTSYICGNQWVGSWGGGLWQTFVTIANSPTSSWLTVLASSDEDPTINSAEYVPFIYSGPANGLTEATIGVDLPCTNPPTTRVRTESVVHSSGADSLTIYIAAAQRSIPFPSYKSRKDWIAQQATYETVLQNPAFADSSTILQTFALLSANSRFTYIDSIQKLINVGDDTDALILLADSITFMQDTLIDSISDVQIADGSTANTIVQNYKDYFSLLIKYQLGSLSNFDSSQLIALANKCPFIDGSIIYNVRTLYGIVFNSPRHFFDGGCDFIDSTDVERRTGSGNNDNSNISAVSAKSKQQYQIYPNPNNGIFILQQALLDINPVSIEILNETGSITYKSIVIFANKQANFHTTGLSNGVYLLKLIDSNGNVYTIKFLKE